jgi:L-threonylcarbamoyladenylate synthase
MMESPLQQDVGARSQVASRMLATAAMARVLPFNDETIAAAGRLIGEGQPVAVPTETVYGLAADATNGEAVARIYAAKGRPSFNPLIVHVPDLAAAERLVVFDEVARELAAKYWPGPLTLVLPARAGNGIAAIVSAGLPTLAVRVPAHPAMRALLMATGKPLAAPSANASGRISPTRAAHVVASLDGRVPLVIDAGATGMGIESTIARVVDGKIEVLRLGSIDLGALTGGDAIVAPGQMAAHYAPAKPLRLDADHAETDEFLIGFGAVAGDASLSASGDPVEAAANLYDLLHIADASDRARIAVAPVPQDGLGAAINDRLKRASHG